MEVTTRQEARPVDVDVGQVLEEAFDHTSTGTIGVTSCAVIAMAPLVFVIVFVLQSTYETQSHSCMQQKVSCVLRR